MNQSFRFEAYFDPRVSFGGKKVGGSRVVLDELEITYRVGHVERLIGTIRREFIDQVPLWTAGDLERKLAEFQAHYNVARSHASLEGHTPLTFADRHPVAPANLSHVRWVSHCRGLVQLAVVTTNSESIGKLRPIVARSAAASAQRDST